jgi:hypothetical protein
MTMASASHPDRHARGPIREACMNLARIRRKTSVTPTEIHAPRIVSLGIRLAFIHGRHARVELRRRQDRPSTSHARG